MGRKKDQIWYHVEKLNDKVFKCKYCGEEFTGGALRVKAHLFGIEGKGIRTCTGVPKDAQTVASSTFADSNKIACSNVNACNAQQNIVNSNTRNDSSGGKSVPIHADVPENVQRASFSTMNDSNQSIMMNVNSSFLEVNSHNFNQSVMRNLDSSYFEMNCLNFNQTIIENVDSGDPNLISNQSITTNTNASDLSKGKLVTGRKKDRFWQYVETSLDGRVNKCMFCGHEFVGGASRIKWHLSKTEKMGVDICNNVPEDVRKAAYDVSNKRFKSNIDSSHLKDNFVNSNSLSDSSKGNTKLYPMPTKTDLIGVQFQAYIDKIWGWLMNKESLIGVCGMGGVGKTKLLQQIYNKLLDASHHVIWVSSVPRDNSIFQLQKIIVESFDLHISDKDDKLKIIARIFHTLNKTKNCVIILDDVWDDIHLESVGIPLMNSEIQVIIASRLYNVCQAMGCTTHILKVEPQLSEYDGDNWHLFSKILGKDESLLSFEVTNTAKSMVKECGGLPLAIATMARSMRGKDEIREWKYALKCLTNLEKGQEDITKCVYPVLKLSYIHLNEVLQDCLLQCALQIAVDRREGSMYETIRKQDLITLFADEGLINKNDSLEAQFDEGHIILNKLINSNLLFEEDEWYIGFNKFVWAMAISIAEEREGYMVKITEDLREVPAEQEWKENLQKAWLFSTKGVPSGASPKCPKLSTLLLSFSDSLKLIPDNFFINMVSLKVLNLSYCRQLELLPASVSNLDSLTALLLHHCSSLESVPSLAKLQKLERLDLSWTGITDLPLGLEMLINLRWLNLEETEGLIIPRPSVILKLINLQVLLLNVNSTTETEGVKIEDLEGLKRLESISACFNDRNEFNAYVGGIVSPQNVGIRNYFLKLVGETRQLQFAHEVEVYGGNKIIELDNVGNTNDLLLPVDMNELTLVSCHEWRCLCDVLSFHDKTKITECKISRCNDLEHVFCFSSSCSFCGKLQSLEKLLLDRLRSLSMLCKETNVTATAPRGPFSSLRFLVVKGCRRMKTLLTPGMTGHLQNLEILNVDNCNEMEEIFSSEKNVDIDDQLWEDLSPIVADALHIDHTHATRIQLPKLKSVSLCNLPLLKRVYVGILACDSLQEFKIMWCSNLKEIPQIQPLFQEFEIQDC